MRSSKLQREMQKQGLNAKQNLPNAYDHDFVRENAALFEGNFIEPLYAPWETTPQSPATKAYLAGSRHHERPVELTEFGWIDAMQFVDGLKGAGPEFTQQKVIDYLNAQKAYTAQGLVPPIDWTTGHIDPMKNVAVRAKEQCQPIMQIKGGKFVLFDTPADKPFTCLDTAKPRRPDPRFTSRSHPAAPADNEPRAARRRGVLRRRRAVHAPVPPAVR